MRRSNTLAIALIAGLTFVLAACSSDKDNKKDPQIISSSAGSGESRPGGASVDILRSSGGLGLSIAPVLPGSPQQASIATSSRGVTVRRTETGVVPADDAYVVVLSQALPVGPGGPIGVISSRNQAELVKALEAIGVKKEDVRFDLGGAIGPFSSVAVHTPLQSISDQGKKVVDAVEGVLGRSSSSGVRFGLTNCTAAFEPARKKAFAAAQEEAKSFASLASLNLGPIAAISETISPPVVNGPTPPDPCNPLASSAGPGISNLEPLDAKPEATVRLEVTLTYSIGLDGVGGEAAGLTASGSGSATAKADEAYILITANTQSGPFGPQAISTKARNDLMAKLKVLKIEEDDIQIASQPFGGSTVISVETGIKDMPTLGRNVSAAVEEALNLPVNTQGVRFTHLNCEAVLLEARKQAFADAKRSTEALAGVAGVKLGALVALSEPQPSTQSYAPVQTSAGCNEDFTQSVFKGYGGAGLKPFDAEPEFTISAVISVTYAINP